MNAGPDEEFFTEAFADVKLDKKISRADTEARWIVNQVPGDTFLDLGCGRGRVSIELAKLGRRVVGIDTNQRYLMTAQRRAAAAGVDAEWRCQSYLDLDDHERFDGAVSLFTSFGYHSDESNRDVLRRVAHALRPGGGFVLEIVNRDAPRITEQKLDEETTHDARTLVKHYSFDAATHRRTMVFSYRTGEHVTEVGRLSVRAYTAEEMISLLREVGFGDIELYGTARGDAHRPRGDHNVFVGRKR